MKDVIVSDGFLAADLLIRCIKKREDCAFFSRFLP